LTRAILGLLIAKEWHLFRWLIAGSVAVGLLALATCTTSKAGFYFGSVSFICVLVFLAVMLPMSGALEERKNKTLLFMLSLPLSPAEYGRATVVANGSAFLAPWLVLGTAAVATNVATALPDGLIPFTLMLLGYFLVYYAFLLGVVLVTGSPGAATATIVAGNVGVNFFLYLVTRIPTVGEHIDGPVAVWNRAALSVLAAELGLAALIIALSLSLQARKRDFV
jgi:hypothetical protein